MTSTRDKNSAATFLSLLKDGCWSGGVGGGGGGGGSSTPKWEEKRRQIERESCRNPPPTALQNRARHYPRVLLRLSLEPPPPGGTALKNTT